MEKLRRILGRIFLLTLALLLAGSLSLSAAAQSPAKAKAAVAKFKAGTYTTVGNGRNGPIVVQVKFSPTAITDIKIISHNETYLTGDVPISSYPDLIVKNQSLAVDTVSGATISSMALMSAIFQAVKDAGGDPAALRTPIRIEAKPAADTAADVVVVGAGGAGLTAAIHAAAAGSKVILLEKLGILGGTSSYSIESFGASESNVHKGLGVKATSKDMYDNYVKSNPKGDPAIFEVFANKNGEAANWLMSIGAQLPVTNSPFGVQSSREVGKLGQSIVAALTAEAKKKGVDCRINSQATKLVMDKGAIAGVQVKGPAGNYTIKAKAVVLATGGFAANNEMVAKYQPSLKGYRFSSSRGATGDGQLMAEAVGAKLRDLDYIRVNFTYYAKGARVYYTGSLMNTGGIFVNNEGKRIMNDGGGYGVGMKVVEQGGTGWMVFDRSLIDSIQDVREYYDQGFFESAPTIRELAKKIGVNEDNLAATIERYVGFVKAGKDADFNRTRLNMTFDEPPFYACKATAHIQGTFGGIVTNADTQVISTSGAAIPGLYAAGEVAGPGTWGANPAAANVVFGTIAGKNAAAYAK